MRTDVIVSVALVIGLACAGAAAHGQTATLPAPRPSVPEAASAEKADAAKKPVDAADGRCDVCGGCVRVRTVCVPKPKEREIKKVHWSSRCEDFCIPGPSEYCGRKCGTDECGCRWHELWKPTCAGIRTKQVPVKTEVKRTVPGVEWIPEERCSACRGKCRPEPSSPAGGR